MQLTQAHDEKISPCRQYANGATVSTQLLYSEATGNMCGSGTVAKAGHFWIVTHFLISSAPPEAVCSARPPPDQTDEAGCEQPDVRHAYFKRTPREIWRHQANRLG